VDLRLRSNAASRQKDQSACEGYFLTAPYCALKARSVLECARPLALSDGRLIFHPRPANPPSYHTSPARNRGTLLYRLRSGGYDLASWPRFHQDSLALFPAG